MFGDYFMKTVTVIKNKNVFFKQPKPTNERATSKTQKTKHRYVPHKKYYLKNHGTLQKVGFDPV